MDSIDETDILEELVEPRVVSIGGKLDRVVLTGNHATPLAPVSFVDFLRNGKSCDLQNNLNGSIACRT